MGILRNHSRKTLLYVATFIAVTIVVAVLVKPDRTAIGFVAWAALILVSLLLLVAWHARAFAYRCRDCGHEFQISLWTDLLSPHGLSKGGGWKYLRCPKCGQRTMAIVIPKGGG
ncbi:MAG: zinc ribbon domain-containing protein [Chloroflexi bacterium]|nr:zinc ribbon domain-containing protein [Chloroflexota bacterium]